MQCRPKGQPQSSWLEQVHGSSHELRDGKVACMKTFSGEPHAWTCQVDEETREIFYLNCFSLLFIYLFLLYRFLLNSTFSIYFCLLWKHVLPYKKLKLFPTLLVVFGTTAYCKLDQVTEAVSFLIIYSSMSENIIHILFQKLISLSYNFDSAGFRGQIILGYET